MRINYFILHYNRPYFADLHLKLAKKYFPFVNKFVLIDDGSDKQVFDKISSGFDLCYRNNCNKNEWKDGSAGNSIYNAFSKFNSDVIIFSEDDFLPCPTYFDDSSSKENFLSPDIIFPNSYEASGMNFKTLKYVIKKNGILSLSKSHYGWKRYLIKNKKEEIFQVNTNGLKRRYSNWPWAMSGDMATKVFPASKNVSMWQLESVVDKNLKKLFGNYPLYAVNIKNYIHAGFVCSTRKESFSDIGKFNKNRKLAISNFFNKEYCSINIDSERSFLCEKFISGKRMDQDILFNLGLHACLKEFYFN